MKTFILIIALLAITQGSVMETLRKYRDEGYEVLEQSMGQFQVRLSETETHIFETGINVHTSPSLRETFEAKYKGISKKDIEDTVIHCAKGKSGEYFNFLAYPMGVVGNNGKSQQVYLDTNEDTCFKKIFLSYQQTSDNSYTLDLIGSERQGSVTCTNMIQISTGESYHLPVIMSAASAKHTINVTDQSAAQMESVQKWGIHIFQTCDKLANLIPDVILTAKLIIGGLTSDPEGEGIFNSAPTVDQVQNNLEFLQRGKLYEWQKRENPVFVDLDDTEVHPGDFIIISRFDGIDQLIQWGAGGNVGHTCVFLEIDGEMMVVESQDGWYWPKHGIQRNTWKQWKQWALNAGFNVAILPLNEEKRAQFIANQDKVVEFFKEMEGYPYGYHNFIFGWLDDTEHNVPPVTTMDYLFILFCQLEKVIPDTTNYFMAEALNIRLGTKGLTLPQIANTAFDRGMTIPELMNIPEQDDWVYSDGPANVCSSFVTRCYKAAGMFDGIEVQGTEFTPRDVYQLNFWNTTATLPEKCTNADPNLPYCQVMGDYVMEVESDGWNTVRPYDNMFERCPSMTPLFERDTSYPNGC